MMISFFYKLQYNFHKAVQNSLDTIQVKQPYMWSVNAMYTVLY